MRAREPDTEGYVDRDGVKLHHEVPYRISPLRTGAALAGGAG